MHEKTVETHYESGALFVFRVWKGLLDDMSVMALAITNGYLLLVKSLVASTSYQAF